VPAQFLAVKQTSLAQRIAKSLLPQLIIENGKLIKMHFNRL